MISSPPESAGGVPDEAVIFAFGFFNEVLLDFRLAVPMRNPLLCG